MKIILLLVSMVAFCCMIWFCKEKDIYNEVFSGICFVGCLIYALVFEINENK